MDKQQITHSAEETKDLGRRLGAQLQPGDCIALYGELGAGKTVFVKGLAEGAGSLEKVVSPTFLHLLEYSAAVPIYHLDAYFQEREIAFLEEAASEIFSGRGAVVVEWADRVESYLPQDRLEIFFEFEQGDQRRIQIAGTGARGKQLEEKLLSS